VGLEEKGKDVIKVLRGEAVRHIEAEQLDAADIMLSRLFVGVLQCVAVCCIVLHNASFALFCGVLRSVGKTNVL